MKKVFSNIADKLLRLAEIIFKENAKITIITGCVLVAGATGVTVVATMVDNKSQNEIMDNSMQMADFGQVSDLKIVAQDDGALEKKSEDIKDGSDEENREETVWDAVINVNGEAFNVETDLTDEDKIPQGYSLQEIEIKGMSIKTAVNDENGQILLMVRNLEDDSYRYFIYIEDGECIEYIAPEEKTEEQIIDMLSNVDEQVEVIAIENLEVVEDTSTEPETNRARVVEVEDPVVENNSEVSEDDSEANSGEESSEQSNNQSTVPSSSELYEVEQLVHGIDVSRWQGDIDWTAVAQDGIDFAIIKCGGGDAGLYEDVKFRKNIEGALANGLQVGVYFFSGAHTVEEVYKEASLCIDLIKDYQITYPVAFDWELDLDGHSPEEITNVAETFLDIVASYGYTPMMYSSRNWYYYYMNGEELCSKYKTWMACYWSDYYYTSTRWEYGDGLPNFKYNYDIWQYGATDTVAGINGYVDMNIAFFGYANYKVNNLTEPSITVDAEPITLTEGETTDFLSHVTAVNSIGYQVNVEEEMYYYLYDNNNQEVYDDYAFNNAGTYKLLYKFKDPKKGWIEKSLSLIVKEKATQSPTNKTEDSSKKKKDASTSGSTEDSASGTTENSAANDSKTSQAETTSVNDNTVKSETTTIDKNTQSDTTTVENN